MKGFFTHLLEYYREHHIKQSPGSSTASNCTSSDELPTPSTTRLYGIVDWDTWRPDGTTVMLYMRKDGSLFGIPPPESTDSPEAFLKFATAVKIFRLPVGAEAIDVDNHDRQRPLDLRHYTRYQLANPDMTTLLLHSVDAGIVTIGQIHTYYASNDPSGNNITDPIQYSITGPFSTTGFDIRSSPPRFQLPMRNLVPSRSEWPHCLYDLNIALYIYAHISRYTCTPWREEVVERYQRYFSQSIEWGATTLWDVTRLYGFGQDPQSGLELALLAFYERLHCAPSLLDLISWLLFHKVDLRVLMNGYPLELESLSNLQRTVLQTIHNTRLTNDELNATFRPDSDIFAVDTPSLWHVPEYQPQESETSQSLLSPDSSDHYSPKVDNDFIMVEGLFVSEAGLVYSAVIGWLSTRCTEY